MPTKMTKEKLKTYFPGKGCQCGAWNGSECGCNADWTPKEIYELKIQVTDLRKALKLCIKSMESCPVDISANTWVEMNELVKNIEKSKNDP